MRREADPRGFIDHVPSSGERDATNDIAARERLGETVDLTLATHEVDGRTVVAVGGEIDVYTAPKLRDKITELV
ncbi:MAG TPA: hypothetical protein VFI99_04840, partial [Nocardioides sp.]|nr:hypothetical protein [Nocardioides sp.]